MAKNRDGPGRRLILPYASRDKDGFSARKGQAV